MALLTMILRKMQKNKSFMFLLVVGLIICASLLSAIPMYTNGALTRVLISGLENYQDTNNIYPGLLSVTYAPSDIQLSNLASQYKNSSEPLYEIADIKNLLSQRTSAYGKLERYLSGTAMKKLPVGTAAGFTEYTLNPRALSAVTGPPLDRDVSCTLESMTDLDSHIRITDGAMPKKTGDGVYEVLVSASGLQSLHVTLGHTYSLTDPNYIFGTIRVKPVGTFDVKNSADAYWSAFTPDELDKSMLLEDSVMQSNFVKKQPTQLDSAQWYYALKYQSLTSYNAGNYVSAIDTITGEVSKITQDAVINAPSQGIVKDYFGQKQQLTVLMWALNVPVIVLLCLYLFMVSALIIQKEKNEITLLASRGAGRLQITSGYLIEGLLLGALAFLIGPEIGYLICRMLGASSDFMEFVSRKALPLRIAGNSFGYALLAVAVFLITLSIPAFLSGKQTIVEHKRRTGRQDQPAWQKFFLDIILIAVSAYGYYLYQQRTSLLASTGATAGQTGYDPTLFFMPVIFIIGLSLLFLRIYPYLIRLVTVIGRKHYRPPAYLALTQVGRSAGTYGFIMIFLILTLSVGIFSANTARTINQNAEDNIYYNNGADLVTQSASWSSYNPSAVGSAGSSGSTSSTSSSGGSDASGTASGIKPVKLYQEPDYSVVSKVKGISHSAKVMIDSSVHLLKQNKDVNFMAIEPYDFGQVVWYRSGLLPYHINDYLNLLSSEPTACLISTSMSKTYGLKPGSSIQVMIQNHQPVTLNVYAVVDYWPSWNPKTVSSATDQFGRNTTASSMEIVANLDYIQNNIGVTPYQVWMKMKPGATSQEVYNSLAKYDISVMKNSKQDIIKLRNDPFQMAVNGSLTMGFLISGIVCLLEFVLFWVLSLRARALQFGLLRAIGISSAQLKRMIVWEQLLTSGAGVVMGLICGFAASVLFIPFFQTSFSSSTQATPFRVVSYPSDLVKVFIFVGLTVLIGGAILVFTLSRLKISSAIKLGED